ncbi:MAG: NAD(P)H-hydrate dehydratase [Candidatus Binatia bacterium]
MTRRSGRGPSDGRPSRPVLVVTAAEMREIDRLSIEEYGIAGDVLMERAGTGAVAVLRERFPRQLRDGVVLVAGKGNNGGDAFVMARHLRRRRVRCEVFLAGQRSEISGDAARNLKRLERGGGRVREIDREGLPALAAAIAKSGIVVDGLYGTGLRGPLGERAQAIIETMNLAPGPIVAVDIPSGLDADRGVELGGAVQATLTVTFVFPKVGLLSFPGAGLAGEIAVVDIGVAPEAVERVRPRQRLLGPESVSTAIPTRAPDSHKGTYGHVLVIAGSRGKSGAAVLAGRAALRAGAGLATIASPAGALGGALGAAPELMTEPLPGRDGAWAFSRSESASLLHALDGKTSVVYGPGIGATPATRTMTEWLLAECPLPMVIDADGLNCLAGQVGWLASRRAPTILTPHPGEMARLIGGATADVQNDRPGSARRLAGEYGVVVVLKGARTVIATPEGLVALSPTGNPGMASGGMGDALSGILGALLAQGLAADEAAAAGVFWHGHAADRVAARRGEAGLLATDVIEELPPALRELQATLTEA